ncbi:Hypothetical protein LUCI_4576 [Lucifera butyrica]|uniref:Chromosome partition protein Smc n=1 Tax=Lucifera butyrica TaxID=1351585 RepID=A0A498R9A2_9FIRM|nr:DUF3084 domain-containing protein [Lucifera butyrica]VBB09286.1 Hypothetical protein LUCI_4576 [Lucifera butyrica]
MYGLALIAVLVVMGGAIAYIGDKLGTKVGKRKLTIFGLRPKHTSIVVTVITGILIAASTLGILTLTSQNVRTALFGMEALRAQLDTLSQEVRAKSVELETNRAELAAKTKEYSALTAKIKDTAAKLAEITGELTEVTAERDRTAAALATVQNDYALAKGDLTKAQSEIQALQKTKTELDTRVNDLNQAKTTLQSDVDRLNDLTGKLKNGIQFVREGTVVFRAGEVLMTGVLPGGKPRAETEKALAGLVYQANRIIADKLEVKDKKLEVLWIARSDFDQVVTALSSASEDVVVRISSSGNTIYGEPVIGRIDLFPNRLVYKEGAVVYSETVDVGYDGKQAEEAVIQFLQKVNASAVKQGILPDPLKGTVGVMSGAELFDTVNRVRRIGGQVVLTAVTQNNVYTIGPLKVDIRVKSSL